MPQGNHRSICKNPSEPPLIRRELRNSERSRNLTTEQETCGPKEGRSGIGIKAPAQHKSALKTEGLFLKGKGKEAAKPKKQARFEADVGSESD